MKIELSDDETYRISEGADDSPEYDCGDIVDFGEMAWFEKDGQIYVAFISAEGETDGRIYQQSAGVPAEMESNCEFEDEDEDEDADEAVENAAAD